jgi:glyoxylase-like metal-dependent hydrolase (beta-lactamase superfamily II)
MIDAGMDRTGAEEFARVLETLIGAGEGEFHGDVAEQLGPAVHDVRGVGFTHLHIDHTQGLGVFCAARGPGAAVYQTRWQAEEHNFNTTEGAAIVRDSCLEARRLEGEGVMPIAGFPGLGAIALGGHTPGSTAFVAAVDGRLWLFSGDITNDKASIRADAGKGFLYSYLLVPENTARTAELRHWLAELDARDDTAVIVSHDAADARASRLAAYAHAP